MTNVLRWVLVIAAVGCGGSSKPDMFAKDNAVKAVAAIVAKTGYEKPRAYMVKVTAEQVTVRLEDPAKPGTLKEWWFYKGKARGPQDVTLIGEGSLEPGLFPLTVVDFAKIPKVIANTKQQWEMAAVEAMEVRVREGVQWNGAGVSDVLDFEWYVSGKTKNHQDTSVSVAPDGTVPVPHAKQITNHAAAGEWAQALQLCDYNSVKRIAGVADACQPVFEPALAHLAQAGDTARIRTVCLHAQRIGGTLATACAAHGAAR